MTVSFYLVGCAVGPNYHAPNIKMPDDFIASSSETKKIADSQSNHQVIDAAKWWEALGDRELNSLVERAIQGSPDIEIALNRLQEARMQEAVVMGEVFEAVLAGATDPEIAGVEVVRRPALTACRRPTCWRRTACHRHS